MSLIRGLCTITVVVLFLVGTSASGATLQLGPTEGNVGDTVQASGTGFTPDFVVTLDFDGLTNFDSVRIPADGTFSVVFEVPLRGSGDYTVTATELSTGIQATAVYTILPYPEITIGLVGVVPGNVVTVSGHGFGNSEAVEIDFGITTNIANGTSNTYGQFTLTFVVDLQPEGTKTVTARGVTTGLSASTDIEILPYPPEITIGFVGVVPGNVVTVSGHGFGNSEAVEIDFGITTNIANGTSNTYGQFTLTFVVDLQPEGTKTVTARGVTTGLSATATIELSAAEVSIPDPNLEALLRSLLGGEPLIPSNLASITSLWASSDISDLTGMEYLISLQTLVLRRNQISDISALAGLTRLQYLNLDYNQISDISALAGLTQLDTLTIYSNQVTNLLPLVNNPGIGTGDMLYVDSNPLDAISRNTYIPVLRNLGVIVLDHPVPVSLASFTGSVSENGIELHWRTASERANLGFNVYRSDSEDGPYTKVNLELIKGAGTDATSHDYTYMDEGVVPGKTYYYAIEDVDFSGNRERHSAIEVTYEQLSMSTESVRVERTALLPNYPNPFNPETWFPYELAEAAEVMLNIYDVSGMLVKRLELGQQAAGDYIDKAQAAHWDGRNEAGESVGSGTYFYQLQTGDFTATRRMVILK